MQKRLCQVGNDLKVVRTWWNGDGGWSEGVKWKKRALVVDENLSFVECRNFERAESDVVEYFEELR